MVIIRRSREEELSEAETSVRFIPITSDPKDNSAGLVTRSRVFVRKHIRLGSRRSILASRPRDIDMATRTFVGEQSARYFAVYPITGGLSDKSIGVARRTDVKLVFRRVSD